MTAGFVLLVTRISGCCFGLHPSWNCCSVVSQPKQHLKQFDMPHGLIVFRASAAQACRGFTLVELMVVTALLAGLMTIVLAVGRPSPGAYVREYVQGLSSAMLATQTRAITAETGAALVLRPSPDGLVSNKDVLFADVPPFAVGQVVSGMPGPGDLTSAVTLKPSNVASLTDGYRIRFSSTQPQMPESQWFSFSPTTSGTTGTVKLIEEAGQTIQTIFNTVWPQSPAGGQLNFAMARRPRSTTRAFESQARAGIDLRWSGLGDSTFSLAEARNPITFVFDRLARLNEIITSVGPITPTSPVYVLIAPRDDISAGIALQSRAAKWLAIAPSTGRITIAPNVPVPDGAGNNIVAARANARAGATTAKGAR